MTAPDTSSPRQSNKKNRSVLSLLLFLPLLCSAMLCVSSFASGLYFPNDLSDISALSTADYSPWEFIRVLPIDARIETEVVQDRVSRETPVVVTDEAGDPVTSTPVVIVSNPQATTIVLLVAQNPTATQNIVQSTPSDVPVETETPTLSVSDTPVETLTPTLTLTPDPSATPTPTSIPTETPTATATLTPFPTSTNTPVPVPPVANFTVALNGLTVTPTNLSTGTITSYSWAFGDGVGKNALANPSSYTYATAGTYTITLTVTGPGGSNTATSTVVVAPPVPPSTDLSVALFASNLNPEAGNTVTVTATITNNTATTVTGVTVGMNFESGLIYQGYTGVGAFDGSTWGIGTLPANSTVSIQMTVLANAGGSSRITSNLATVSPFDNNTSNNSATVIINTQAAAPTGADVSLSMNVNPTSANIGDTVAYSLTATNNGPQNASNVVITQTLPTGINFVSAPGCTTLGQVVTCALGSLSNGASSSVTVNAQISQSGTLTSSASVSASESDPNTSNNNASASVNVNAVDVDLNLAMSVSSNTPAEGSTITYLVTLSNNGTNPATNIGINVALPSSVTFILGSTSSGAYNSGSGRWTIPSLGMGNSVTLSLIASVNNGTSGTTSIATANTATLSENDPTPANASVDITPTVATAFTDLSTTLSGPSGNVNDNSDLNYTATIINSSAFTATNIVATINVSPSITLTNVAGNGTFDSATNTWTIGTLTPGQDANLSFRIRVSTSQGHSTVTTSVSPSSFDQSDSDPSNNVASRTVSISINNPGITLGKSVNSGRPNIGQNIVYRVRLRNRDIQNYTGVQVTDNLPSGVTYVSHTADKGTFDVGSGIWNVGTVNIGETLDLNITVQVDNTSGGSRITNTASITAFNETDPNTSNNTSSVQIIVNTVGLVLDKSVNVNNPVEGNNVVYTLNLWNRDTIDYTTVQITDFLPAGVTYLSSIADHGAYDSASSIWNIPTLTAGIRARLQITVQVDIGTAGTTISNQANIIATTPALPPTSDTFGQADIQPIANPLTNLSLALNDRTTPSSSVYDEGDIVQLEMVVRNNGPQNATNIFAQLTVPSQVTFVSSNSGSYDSATGIWTVGNLNNGRARNVFIRFSINSGAAGQNFTFNGNITSYDQTDPDTSNNSASESFTVSGTDLAVVKTVDNNMPNETDTVTYTIVVSNTGRDTTDVRVTDNLPVGVTYVSHTPSIGTFDNATGEWIVGDMLTGTSAQLEIMATVDTGTIGGTITNTAVISNFTQLDTNTSNNSDSAIITPQ